jgi:hypothetical protein
MLSSKFTGKEAEKLGLEGIMAKRADSLYLSDPLGHAQRGLAEDQDSAPSGGGDCRLHCTAPVAAVFGLAGPCCA